MATRTFTINPVNIGTNEVHSAQRDVPIRVSVIDITLVDGGNWDSVSGDFTWGIESSVNGGSTWQRLVWQTLAIGSHGKGGRMPGIGVTRSDLGNQDISLRLFASSTATVNVGASIVAST